MPAVRAEWQTGAMAPEQEIRFATTADGFSLAYSVAGSGPPLVKAANWLMHLEYDWDSPVMRPYVEALSSRFTYVRYDERGTGLSQGDISDLSFDDFVSDLEAVVDEAAIERFPLLGISQGASVAIAYAVRHPERVTHLILVGGYARGRIARGDESGHALQRQLIEHGWGTDDPALRHVFTSQFLPGGTAPQQAWFNELMRRSATTENALIVFDVMGRIDVTDVAPLLTVPTLILHAAGDRRVPFEEGRRLAGLVPGARLVQLDTDNHLPLGDEPAWQRLIGELTSFVGATPPARGERSPSTALLMSDIVDSTRLLDAMGDEAWAQVLRWHDNVLEDQFEAHGGRVVKHTGDGFLVAFDDEGSAVSCAVEIQRRLAAHRKQAGFAPQVRMGVNSGAITRTEDDVGGIEVHKAARVASAAEGDEILVSQGVAARTEDRFGYDEPRTIPAKGIDDGLVVRAVRW